MSKFSNKYPHTKHTAFDILKWKLGIVKSEPTEKTIPEFPYDAGDPASPFSLTWIGHASFMLQLDQHYMLIDPVFGKHCSPFPIPSLRRRQAPAIMLENLPEISYVLITHSHYDHLETSTIRALAKRAIFLIPDGMAPWFYRLGCSVVIEAKWWQRVELTDDLSVTATPAQHGTARHFFDRDTMHWCGWMIEYKDKKIYNLGDSGYCPHFKEVSERFDNIDLSIIPIGAYNPRSIMEPVHLNPSDAVKVHRDLKSKRSVASHWGTFKLTDENLNEPPYELKKALREESLDEKEFLVIKVGDTISLI